MHWRVALTCIVCQFHLIVVHHITKRTNCRIDLCDTETLKCMIFSIRALRLVVGVSVFHRYPNTACELLTSDVSQINDRLACNNDLIDRLYSFLETEGSLNPLLASFFSKVMSLLITRKSDLVCVYHEHFYHFFVVNPLHFPLFCLILRYAVFI